MKLHSGMILASSILLTACGGGGGGGGGGGDTAQKQVTPPSNSEALTISAKPSQLYFEWAAVEAEPGDDVCYQLSVNPDGVSGYTLLKVADDGDELTDSDEEYCTTETNFTLDISPLNLQWDDVQYMLSSCMNSQTDCVTITSKAPSNTNMQNSITTITNPYWQDIVDIGERAEETLYGGELAASSDGNTLVIGSPFDSSYSSIINTGHTDILKDLNGFINAIDYGAAYVYRRKNNIWSLEAYLKASTNQHPDPDDLHPLLCFCGAYSLFGKTVSISDDGNTIAIGAPRQSYAESLRHVGAAYIYTRENQTWSEKTIINSINSAQSRQFGEFVRLSGDGRTLFAYSKPTTPIDNGPKEPGEPGEIFTLNNNENWEYNSVISDIGGAERLVMSKDGKTIAYATTNLTGVTRLTNGQWEKQTIKSPVSLDDTSTNAEVAIAGNGNTIVISEEIDIEEKNSGISIFQYENNTWQYKNTLYSKMPIPIRDKLKINYAGNQIFAANGQLHKLNTDEGIRSIDSLVSANTNTTELRISTIIRIFKKDNSQWVEKEAIYQASHPAAGLNFTTSNDNLFIYDAELGNNDIPQYSVNVY